MYVDDVKEVLKYIKEDEPKIAPQSLGSFSSRDSTSGYANYKEEYRKLIEFQDKVKYCTIYMILIYISISFYVLYF